MRVFIADDEHQYRSHIKKALERRGHQIEVAETGRLAIARALLFRPEVLVADWMFKDQLHGIHVATALQSVFPGMKTVLISGFASEDLSMDATRAGIDCFLEKPFDVAQVSHAVESEAPPREGDQTMEFMFVELEKSGAIVYANEHARKLLDPSGSGKIPGDLEELLGPDRLEYLERSGTVWTEISPAVAPNEKWYLRSRIIDSTTILFVLPEDQKEQQSYSVLKNLLEIQSGFTLSWPMMDRVIVIDDSLAVRQMYHQSLERVGCVSYRAGSHELSIRLLREDTKLTVAVVDYEMPGIDTKFLINEMRSIRPDIKIVGNSGADHREDFRLMGVDRYLGKPWNISDLIEVLQG